MHRALALALPLLVLLVTVDADAQRRRRTPEPDAELGPTPTLRDLPSLAEKLKRKGALSTRHSGFLAYQLLQALEAAHAKDVLHRDLKPANVFMQWGTGVRLKLIDFGVARDMGGDLTQITEPGLAVGTPVYMAPELIVGKPGDVRTDIYGLGATLFESLADSGFHLALAGITQPNPGSAALHRRFGFETVGGFVTALLGRIPRAGDVVSFGGLRLEVNEVRGRRVRAVDIQVTGEALTTVERLEGMG